MTQQRRDRILLLIAAFKFVKAALLVAVGLGALGFLQPEFVARIEHTASTLVWPLGRERVQRFIEHLSRMNHTKIRLLAIGAFLYASLFTVEGVGLWLQKHWAEYLTIISTALLLPIEVYELTHRITAPRISTLVVNIAVVVYLILRYRHRQKQRERQTGQS
jgi:uncharacterized membrane protein (DUF2068 family)